MICKKGNTNEGSGREEKRTLEGMGYGNEVKQKKT